MNKSKNKKVFSSDGRFYTGQSAWGLVASVKYAYVPTVNREGTTVGEGVELATKSVRYRGILGHFG